MEAEGITAETQGMYLHCDQVLASARTILDKMWVYYVLSDRMASEMCMKEANELCVYVLRQLKLCNGAQDE